MKLVVLDGYTLNPGDLSWEKLEKFGELVVYDKTLYEQTVERIGDAKYIFTNKTIIDKYIIESCPNLKYIGVLATGYNTVDISFAKEKNISVCNVGGYSTSSVAQLTIALLLEIVNNVGLHSNAVHNGEWCNSEYFSFCKSPIVELQGKTLGIIGFGEIGRLVSKISQAFGMKNLIYSRTVYKDFENSQLEFVSLDELYKNSDVISLHCPLFKETEKIINKESINKMKDNVIIINTSRGGLIEEKALKEALDKNKVYAIGLDVLTTEPMEKNHILLNTKNVYITPHIGWASYTSRKRLLDKAINNFENYLSGNPTNLVN